MNRTVQYLLAIGLFGALALAPRPGAASDDSHPKHSREAALEGDRSAPIREPKWERDPIRFTARDREAIRNHYRQDTSNLPPGLAKRNGDLPPGLRKHLRRNGILPPGLQKRLEPLAGEVERRLRTLASGYSRGIIGQDAVIVEDRSHRIMDIIRDVTGRR